MACKYCEHEQEEDGTTSTWCPIDCLPLRGRVQRAVYCAAFDRPLSEVYESVRCALPGVADANISRAIRTLKDKGWLIEGSDCGTRKLSTAEMLRSGDADEGFYGADQYTLSVTELRHLVAWHISEKGGDAEVTSVQDDELVAIVARFVADIYYDASIVDIYTFMEPLVKRLRYLMSSYEGKVVPWTERVASLAGKAGWEGRGYRPVQKQEKGKGWLALRPHFTALWEDAFHGGGVTQRVLKLAACGVFEA